MTYRAYRVMLTLALALLAPAIHGQITTLISESQGNQSGSAQSWFADITPDGRFVAFHSDAVNLVSGDTNNATDCFVYDRLLDAMVRASVADGGGQAMGFSQYPTISDDGQRVVFTSTAPDLVSGDTNGTGDVFVRDLQIGTTTRVSVGTSGVQADAGANLATISGNGRFVAFDSLSTNLVGGDTNATWDVFVHDLDLSTTARVSVSSIGLQGNAPSTRPSISRSGRWVTFQSDAITLTLNDTNGFEDILVRDRVTGQTTLVSKASDGTQANADSLLARVSDDGSSIVFQTRASTLDGMETSANDYDVFVHTIATGTTDRVSLSTTGGTGNGVSDDPDISATGRFVAFRSSATNLVAGDLNNSFDIFVHDRANGSTLLASSMTGGTQSTEVSNRPRITSDGRWVVFDTQAALAEFDFNSQRDVFLRDTFVPWSDLGFGLAGSNGDPELAVSGTMQPNTVVTLTLTNALESTLAYLVGSRFLLQAPFEGGVFVPQPDNIIPFGTDASGGIIFPVLWPLGIPAGATMYLQYWIPDPGGIYGYSASNAVSVTQP